MRQAHQTRPLEAPELPSGVSPSLGERALSVVFMLAGGMARSAGVPHPAARRTPSGTLGGGRMATQQEEYGRVPLEMRGGVFEMYAGAVRHRRWYFFAGTSVFLRPVHS